VPPEPVQAGEPRVILRLVALPNNLYPWIMMRRLLKVVLRAYGWRCVQAQLSDGPYFWGGLGI
jgi:hypothetical protein